MGLCDNDSVDGIDGGERDRGLDGPKRQTHLVTRRSGCRGVGAGRDIFIFYSDHDRINERKPACGRDQDYVIAVVVL